MLRQEVHQRYDIIFEEVGLYVWLADRESALRRFRHCLRYVINWDTRYEYAIYWLAVNLITTP